jgi:hypothetical protein
MVCDIDVEYTVDNGRVRQSQVGAENSIFPSKRVAITAKDRLRHRIRMEKRGDPFALPSRK